MVRSRLVAVVVLLAFGALLIGAGPATAAQGGNDDTAHACQHGGWANLTDPATGQPFTSQGACVSSGAHGSPPLSASLVASDELGCGGTCWGGIIGTGLQPGAPFTWGASAPSVALEFLGPHRVGRSRRRGRHSALRTGVGQPSGLVDDRRRNADQLERRQQPLRLSPARLA